jgi:superfamily I DNA/RNA helicase
VFLDEFQDTTSVQYALTSAIFRGSTCTLTAVGDHKQRIMVWAGARKDAFQAFGEDFLGAIGAAGRLVLTRNYRSNARIVEVLNVLKERLAPEEPDFVALRPTPDLPSEQICAVLEASDLASEAGAVASIVGEALSKGTPARLVGILVRQKAADWEDKLQFAFDAQGIGFRNEDRDVGGAAIQDLMTEAYSQSMVPMDDHGRPFGDDVGDDDRRRRGGGTRIGDRARQVPQGQSHRPRGGTNAGRHP